MNCINQGLIQKYIDKEATVQEIIIVEEHSVNCPKCEAEILAQQKRSEHIKNTMALLFDDSEVKSNHLINGLPKVFFEEKALKGNRKIIRRVIFSGIAASVLLFSFLILVKEDSKPNLMTEEQIMLVQATEREVDANRSVLESDFIINVIDPDGNVIEYSQDNF